MPARQPVPAAHPDLVACGRIAAPHGVRGLVKLQSFTADPASIFAYRPLLDAKGQRVFSLALSATTKDGFIARIDGVADRNAAEALTGTLLYVPRAALPAPEDDDEFYHADLIGLAAVDAAGRVIGTVRAVQDFGAGTYLEIERPGGGALLLPFTKAAVPQIDLAGGRLNVVPPDEIEWRPDDDESDAAERSA